MPICPEMAYLRADVLKARGCADIFSEMHGAAPPFLMRAPTHLWRTYFCFAAPAITAPAALVRIKDLAALFFNRAAQVYAPFRLQPRLFSRAVTNCR